MKRSEIGIIKTLGKGKTFSDLVEATHKSKSFVSKVLKGLIKKDLVKREGSIYRLSSNPKSLLISSIVKAFPNLLIGKREVLLKNLAEDHTLQELQVLTGISLKQIIEYLKEFKSYGVVIEKNGKYVLNKEKEEIFELARLLSLEEKSRGIVWKRGEEILKVSEEEENGSLTAFSLFPDFGIKIFLPRNYYYLPKKKLGLEEILVHSLVFSQTLQEKILVTIFYLKNESSIDKRLLFSLAKKFGVIDRLEEMMNFIEKKETKTYNSLIEKAREYGIEIKPRVSSSEELKELFEEMDSTLKNECSIYLLGGANMVLRGLKISTKDVDVLVDRRGFLLVKEALISMGFSHRDSIFERGNYRVDLFKERILRGYRISKGMKARAESFWKGKNLKVYLLSLEDVFLFKSYAGREVDLEDCRILAEQKLNWKIILEESLRQQERMEKVVLLTLMDVLDELKAKYKIETPIEKKLDSYVLERLLLVVLKKPMSIKELVYKLEKPETTLRKFLRKLLKEKKIVKIRKKRKFLYVLKNF
jgi:predicted transcriptional regulator